MAKTVQAPDGTTWRVARQWAPWTIRWRGNLAESAEGVTAIAPPSPVWLADDLAGCLGGAAVWIGGILFVVTAVAFVLPAVVFVVELMLALAVVGLVFAYRVVFRKPWLVTAATNRTVHRRWKRVGWRASGHLVDQVAAAIRSGGPLPF